MPKPLGKMSFVDAAELILHEENRALHVKEIVDKAMKRNLIETKGETPHSTLEAAMYLENKRRVKSNHIPRFKKVGPATWALVHAKR